MIKNNGLIALIMLFTPICYGGAISIGDGGGVPIGPGAGSIGPGPNIPVVSGGGFVLNIGAYETASQMLYQRTSSITNALDRRMREYTDYNQSKFNSLYWIDSYYSDSSRGSGAISSASTNFSNQNYGFTAGARLPINVTPIEAVVNFEQTALNITNGYLNINTSSVIAGLFAPKIGEMWGVNLSSKALMGWGGHSGNRVDFSSSSQKIPSEYDSIYGVVGSALTKSYAINDYLKADLLTGFDIDIQSVSSYSEGTYFQWNSRTMTQLQSRLQTGLSTNLLNNTLSFFGRVGVEQRDLVSGRTQNYQIGGVNLAFNGGKIDNTYLTGQLGTTYQMNKKVQIFGLVSSINDLKSVQAIQGNFGIRASF
jgi:hypothetical protein